jgi:hypothetical protein
MCVCVKESEREGGVLTAADVERYLELFFVNLDTKFTSACYRRKASLL